MQLDARVVMMVMQAGPERAPQFWQGSGVDGASSLLELNTGKGVGSGSGKTAMSTLGKS